MRLIDADALLKALNDYGLSYRADINGMIMQAPTIAPSGDLISRAEAKQAIRDKFPNLADRLEINNVLNSVPSADAVHGEWEHWGSPFSDESEVIDTIVCSVCGARFIEPKDEPKGEYNFCPNCGADMRGDKNEID